MPSPNLSEIAVDLIINQVQNNISATLENIRVARGDNLVTTEPPRQYFNYKPSLVLRAPAVFVVVESGDNRLNRGPNFVSAALRIHCNVCVEDRDLNRLVIKAYRYQAALHHILHLQQLTNADNSLKIVIKVIRFEYSAEYTSAQKTNDATGVFRKEVWLELEVETYENF